MTAVEGEKLMRIGDFGAALGMPEATLRAWERRYGIPTPVRTPGGHRLYRASDVEKVVAILRLIREGMTVRAAAAQVRAGTLGGLQVHRTEASWDHVTADETMALRFVEALLADSDDEILVQCYLDSGARVLLDGSVYPDGDVVEWLLAFAKRRGSDVAAPPPVDLTKARAVRPPEVNGGVQWVNTTDPAAPVPPFERGDSVAWPSHLPEWEDFTRRMNEAGYPPGGVW